MLNHLLSIQARRLSLKVFLELKELKKLRRRYKNKTMPKLKRSISKKISPKLNGGSTLKLLAVALYILFLLSMKSILLILINPLANLNWDTQKGYKIYGTKHFKWHKDISSIGIWTYRIHERTFLSHVMRDSELVFPLWIKPCKMMSKMLPLENQDRKVTLKWRRKRQPNKEVVAWRMALTLWSEVKMGDSCIWVNPMIESNFKISLISMII